MKRLVAAAGLFAWLLTTTGWGQVYAPDTEYHDRAQRRFAVELARVMAWRENAAGRNPQIAEITYELETSKETGGTAWKIHWLDGTGKAVRDFAVSYDARAPAASLEFYRSVAHSLLGETNAGKRDQPEITKAWWAGADMAGDSRAESLRAVFGVDAKSSENAPKLAGLLSQTTVPSIGGCVSLDGVLLARAAAWLSIAESELKPGEKPNDALWAPILFLSGRENAAVKTWEKPSAPDASPSGQWWNFLLSPHTAADAFAFAAEKQNRKRALPLLVHEHLLLDLGGALESVLPALFPDAKSLAAQHDYGPILEAGTTIGGGRITEGAWPLFSRMAFAECLKNFHPEPADFQGYREALNQIKPASEEDESDASLAGLRDAADLLNLGFREGVGKLLPVATVTTRDLLNFGWEMNGAQIAARWRFVAVVWGVPDLAESIAKATVTNLDGAERFLCDYPYRGNQQSAAAKILTRARLTDPKRLQDMDFAPGALMGSVRAFSKDKAENIRLWMRRCWIHPMNLLHICRDYYFANMRDEIGGELRRLHDEGGPATDAQMIYFFIPGTGLNVEGLRQCPGTDEVRRSVIESQSEPSGSLIEASWDKFDKMPPFEKAQALEKLFWKRPGDDLPYADIFSNYLQAHAFKSARRFYSQAEKVIEDPVVFGNTMGARRYMLALVEKDEPTMAEVLRAGRSGSYMDMTLNMIDSVRLGDFKALAEQVDECSARYGQDELMTKVKGFLPLIPALKDPKHSDHGNALDYFADLTKWPALLWVLAEEAKLSPEEAVRFFGGTKADPQRRMLVAYTLKDKALFEKTYKGFDSAVDSGKEVWSNSVFALIHYLQGKLLEIPEPSDQPDLQPPGARSLRQIFAEKMSGAE